jgi:hypothetical protein
VHGASGFGEQVLKLQVPFVQLPLAFDAKAIALEIEALGEEAWRPHPQGYAGNWGLPLLAVNGDPDDDRTAGPMRSTPYLDRCPYTRQVLTTLSAVWGRTRFMRLDGNAEVNAHVDNNYYWRERVRVHVPVITRPDVRFECGDAAINMAAGECWIFDTWRLHRVLNPSEARRIHLVADTVGGEEFWRLVSTGRRHDHLPAGWSPRYVAPDRSAQAELATESFNRSQVMTPWELRDTLTFIFSEARPSPDLARLQAMAASFTSNWHALWSEHGDSEAGKPMFRAESQRFGHAIAPFTGRIALRNEVDATSSIRSLVLLPAVMDASSIGEPTELREHATLASARAALDPAPTSARTPREPAFERPVFVVCAPRSGSTMLFNALSQAPGLYTIGRENHSVLEGVPALDPRERSFDSNRLDASDASEEVIANLRQRYFDELRDRHGQPGTGGPLRMMDKTPKNALRVSFLAKVFPDAQFVFLQRDPRQVLSSMIEAWQSGRFVTYPRLPEWPGSPWSLLLVPGWRELKGQPLAQIVAAQWARTMTILLDDLEALPPERVIRVEYDALRQAPQSTLTRLCEALGLGWDLDAGKELPLSWSTVTPPDPDKWQRHAAEIAAIWPDIETVAKRIERFAAQ